MSLRITHCPVCHEPITEVTVTSRAYVNQTYNPHTNTWGVPDIDEVDHEEIGVYCQYCDNEICTQSESLTEGV